MSMQIQIGKRRTCVRNKKKLLREFWPDALAEFSNSEHARGKVTDRGREE